MQLQELNNVLIHIKPERLLNNDTLDHEILNKNKPCYKYYKIGIDDRSVTLVFGANSNMDYKNPHAANDEMEENSSEYCDYASFWIFRFDGRKLHFVKQMAAG